MQVSRRSFLKYCVGSAAALGLPMVVAGKLEEALAAEGAGLPTVIWLNGANCTGCTISLSNLFSDNGPSDIADLLVNYLNLAFHPNLMGAAGDLAVQKLNEAAGGDYILAIDGGVPTAFDGHTCILWTENDHEVTAKEAVLRLAPKAAAILSIGSCASFGGIPSGDPNPTDIVSVSSLLGRQTIHIPGCPTHPDWIVWTVANLLAGVIPELDSQGRPRELFKEEIHKKCPRKGQGETKIFGQDGVCLKSLGCKGPRTKADCHIRQWNNGTNWCIGANAVCLGCTESGFPDSFAPFYKIEYGYKQHQPDQTDDSNASLRLTKAEYRVDRSELKVDGEGPSGSIVEIENADSNALLGAISPDSYGKYKFRLYNPSPVPARVRARCGDEMVARTVETVTTAGQLDITKCEWVEERAELKVDGKADREETVAILNAATATVLGIVHANLEGKWKFRLNSPSSVPCRVRAAAAEKVLEKAVKYAPGGCI